MENDEEPITLMARTLWEFLKPAWQRRTWEEITDDERHRFEVAATKSHTAYHDQYERMQDRSARGMRS
jgi:hypothetical protein